MSQVFFAITLAAVGFSQAQIAFPGAIVADFSRTAALAFAQIFGSLVPAINQGFGLQSCKVVTFLTKHSELVQVCQILDFVQALPNQPHNHTQRQLLASKNLMLCC